MTKLKFALLLALFSFYVSSQQAQLITQVEGILWGFDFLTSDEILMTTREGVLFHYEFKSKKLTSLVAPPSIAKGQGGLLDLKVINIKNESFIYITHTVNEKEILTTALSRARWNFKTQKMEPFTRLFTAQVHSNTTRHFGSRLALKNDQLFMTVGDRGERAWAQKLNSHQGKILRLTLDGKPFANNPFVKEKHALPEIWTYGHRNPQGIFYDPLKDVLYSCEFGPKGGDELNIIEKGKNYGWPIITYGREYYGPTIGTTHQKGMEQPLAYWVPSISPSGMTVYTGDKIPQWKNHLFLANLSSTHLRRIEMKNQKILVQEKLFENLNERIRQVQGSPRGELFFSTDSGKLYQVISP